jgi:hypothetical protein
MEIGTKFYNNIKKDLDSWYSISNDKYFNIYDTYKNTEGDDWSFWDDESNFLDGEIGIELFLNYIKALSGIVDFESFDICYNSNIIYTENEFLNKYKDSKILIVGAGPSFLEFDYKVDDYDYIWSVNKYFMSDDVGKVDLISIGDETFDIMDDDVKNKIINTTTDIVLEPKHLFYKPCHKNVIDFISNYPDKFGYFHTRYSSKLGSIPRLIIFAIFMGVSEINVIGFDGQKNVNSIHNNPHNNPTVKHSFEGNKKLEMGKRYPYTTDIFYRQNIIFAEYLLRLQKIYDFKFTNCGEFYGDNIMGPISKKYFSGDENK